jgi:hypothetical protein
MVLRFDPTQYKQLGFYTARKHMDVYTLRNGKEYYRESEQLEALGRSMTEEHWRRHDESTSDHTPQCIY